MTPKDRMLLLGGAASISLIVGLYLGMAIIAFDDSFGNETLTENPAGSASDDGIDPVGPSLTLPAGASSSTRPAALTGPALDSGSRLRVPPAPLIIPQILGPPVPTGSSPTGEQVLSGAVLASEPQEADLDPVEQEILRLTNELRAHPSGPLARQKPLPDCVNDPFYGIAIDGSTGHPNSVGALSLDLSVSVEMSRPWAIDMDSQQSLQHRANGSQFEIYERLGIAVAATGENVAWSAGYPDDQAARVHFEGWRESDTGHYCAMVSGVYTSIGVGHSKGATRSWAVQNFYSTR